MSSRRERLAPVRPTKQAPRDDATFPKRCRCGRQFDRAAWERLTYVGVDEAFRLELRNCACGSTLAVPMG
jgi:hypothetical protein